MAVAPKTGREVAAANNGTASLLEQVVLKGDLGVLSPADRLLYYTKVCESVGINPLTKPFDYLVLNGKLVLYANRACAEQLRQVHNVSIYNLEKEMHGDVYVVTAYARNGGGREDAATGAVTLGNLKGEGLANALMKAETKAKRRVTLSICGLGLLDETEVETIPGAQRVQAETPATLPDPEQKPPESKPAPAQAPSAPPADNTAAAKAMATLMDTAIKDVSRPQWSMFGDWVRANGYSDPSEVMGVFGCTDFKEWSDLYAEASMAAIFNWLSIMAWARAHNVQQIPLFKHLGIGSVREFIDGGLSQAEPAFIINGLDQKFSKPQDTSTEEDDGPWPMSPPPDHQQE